MSDLLIVVAKVGLSWLIVSLLAVALWQLIAPRKVERRLPKDPRPPALTLVIPDQAARPQEVGPGRPTGPSPCLLRCGRCGHTSVAPTTLAAIADDQNHFRDEHMLELALADEADNSHEATS